MTVHPHLYHKRQLVADSSHPRRAAIGRSWPFAKGRDWSFSADLHNGVCWSDRKQAVGQHGCKWLVSGNANEWSSPCNYPVCHFIHGYQSCSDWARGATRWVHSAEQVPGDKLQEWTQRAPLRQLVFFL